MLLAEAPKAGPSIQSLKERHFEMMRRLVAGDPAVEICKALGMTQSWFSIVQSSPAFQSELIKLREEANQNAADIGKRLTNLAPDAVSVLEKAIRDQKFDISPFQKVFVARDILDRVGHGKPVAAGAQQASVTVQIVQFAAAPNITPQQAVIIEEG